jgi:hypothetical protein
MRVRIRQHGERHHDAGSTRGLLDRESFADSCPLALSPPPPIRFLYVFLYVAPQVSLATSFSAPLAVGALWFARVVAINFPEDFHLQVEGHAGHTRKSPDQIPVGASLTSAFRFRTAIVGVRY